MSKRAIILAGGKGSRLRPYTFSLPKPLMPVGEHPVLELVIIQLAKAGFNHITLAVSHQAELLQAFFNDGKKWGVRIDYSIEDIPLGTIGPLKLIKSLPENFLIMNGDVITDLVFSDLYSYHLEKNSILTIASSIRNFKNEFGVLEVNKDNILVDFKEKPITKFLVSMGVYIANRMIIELIPEGQVYGFDHLVYDLLSRKTPPTIMQYQGYWLDIGRIDDYETANKDYETIKKFIF